MANSSEQVSSLHWVSNHHLSEAFQIIPMAKIMLEEKGKHQMEHLRMTWNRLSFLLGLRYRQCHEVMADKNGARCINGYFVLSVNRFKAFSTSASVSFQMPLYFLQVKSNKQLLQILYQPCFPHFAKLLHPNYRNWFEVYFFTFLYRWSTNEA